MRSVSQYHSVSRSRSVSKGAAGPTPTECCYAHLCSTSGAASVGYTCAAKNPGDSCGGFPPVDQCMYTKVSAEYECKSGGSAVSDTECPSQIEPFDAYCYELTDDQCNE